MVRTLGIALIFDSNCIFVIIVPIGYKTNMIKMVAIPSGYIIYKLWEVQRIAVHFPGPPILFACFLCTALHSGIEDIIIMYISHSILTRSGVILIQYSTVTVQFYTGWLAISLQ